MLNNRVQLLTCFACFSFASVHLQELVVIIILTIKSSNNSVRKRLLDLFKSRKSKGSLAYGNIMINETTKWLPTIMVKSSWDDA